MQEATYENSVGIKKAARRAPVEADVHKLSQSALMARAEQDRSQPPNMGDVFYHRAMKFDGSGMGDNEDTNAEDIENHEEFLQTVAEVKSMSGRSDDSFTSATAAAAAAAAATAASGASQDGLSVALPLDPNIQHQKSPHAKSNNNNASQAHTPTDAYADPRDTGIRDEVKEYYGKILSQSSDLKTNACCTAAMPSPAMFKLLSNIHSDVNNKYYGCGFVAPALLKDTCILDLGCGAGRDCYILSQLVGEKGAVVGVDMTSNMLETARATVDWHRNRFGYSFSNTSFKLGYIERLGELGLSPSSFDVIVSNCVVNLSPDKESVLKGAYRLLKEGGELYFSDVYCNKRIPQNLRSDSVLWGECLSGALYWNDFLRLAKSCGFLDPRLVESSPISIQNSEIEEKLAGYEFYSATYRLWKLPDLEPDCENYGQAVIYKGSIPAADGDYTLKVEFKLDDHHVFRTGEAALVCGNTWRMLHDTRFKPHFTFIGDFTRHFGIFDGCGKSMPFATASSGGGGACDTGCC